MQLVGVRCQHHHVFRLIARARLGDGPGPGRPTRVELQVSLLNRLSKRRIPTLAAQRVLGGAIAVVRRIARSRRATAVERESRVGTAWNEARCGAWRGARDLVPLRTVGEP